MMNAGALSRFQHDFSRALLADGGALAAAHAPGIYHQPGFAVYRNTVMKGCVDALQANFPAVTRLVGETWMRAAAAIYAREHPPRDPRLMCYGNNFPAFLRTFEPARELPYLPDVARLDYGWCEAHIARDEPALCGADIAALPPEDLGCTVLRPHAAARWAWFDGEPIATIWRANRAGADAAADLSRMEWRGDGVVITRPAGEVRHVAADRAVCVFMETCRAGKTLEQAVLASLAVDAQVDFSQLMRSLIEAGAFAALDTRTEENP